MTARPAQTTNGRMVAVVRKSAHTVSGMTVWLGGLSRKGVSPDRPLKRKEREPSKRDWATWRRRRVVVFRWRIPRLAPTPLLPPSSNALAVQCVVSHSWPASPGEQDRCSLEGQQISWGANSQRSLTTTTGAATATTRLLVLLFL